jgi:hypothetical protein
LPWEEWVLSTAPRCGATEADARGNCHKTCTSDNDCSDMPEGQQTCRSVHTNYCGSKPQPEECNATAPKGGFRCGTSELMARETCGQSCSNNSECSGAGGEYCYAVHSNLCDCDDDDGNNGRMLLRGGKSNKN